MVNKIAYASGSSVALKSFQSFMVNDGLLVKIVEAVKAGEKEARTSGDVKSFEVFYKGFRQNISIGRIYIVPAKVCDVRNTFPIALLYGTVVREFNLGEETADLVENKVETGEFDEYSQADYQSLKDRLFTGADGKSTSLILFAPNWSNIREYVGFKFTNDDEELANLLRHLVFSAYFNPAVSSAFNALMTTVDTSKLDVTDITPKLSYPFLTENPLKAYPALTKQGGWEKPKVFLTVKTADAITMDVLDPEELNVFEALDSALTEVTMPDTQAMEEVADFKGPDGSNAGNAETSQVDGEQPTTADLKDDGGATTGLRRRPDYGESDSYTAETNEANAKEATKASVKEAGVAPNRSIGENETHCIDCGAQYDSFHMCPHVSPADARRGIRNCGKGGGGGGLSLYNKASDTKTGSDEQEFPTSNTCPSCSKKLRPIKRTRNEIFLRCSKCGWTGHKKYTPDGIKIRTGSISEKGEAPIGIELDDTGLPVHASKKKKANNDVALRALQLIDQFFESDEMSKSLIRQAIELLEQDGGFPEA